MYEQQFGFRTRPFSATPDARAFVAIENTQNVLSELMAALRSGGISVVTAPAGLGKTMLGKKLASELRNEMRVARFASANFTNRVGLLQTILFEIRGQYLESDEQKLRLNLLSALSSGDNTSGDNTVEPLALIFDEAHLLTEELLEEIRTLTNLGEDDQSVRVALIGQPELEERLLEPSMAALNQRVRAQLYLDSLTRNESAQFIAAQVEQQGGDIDVVFTPAALRMITIAADGNPRCLNQLCDQSLVECMRSEEVIVDVKCVRTALDDLKKLPLQWNDPGEFVVDSTGSDQSDAVISTDDDVDASESDSIDVTHDEEAHDTEDLPDLEVDPSATMSAAEVAAPGETQGDESTSTAAPVTAVFEVGADDGEETSTTTQTATESRIMPAKVDVAREERIRLDDAEPESSDHELQTAVIEIGAPADAPPGDKQDDFDSPSEISGQPDDSQTLSLLSDECEEGLLPEENAVDTEANVEPVAEDIISIRDSPAPEDGELSVACDFEEVVFDRYTWIEAGVDVSVLDAGIEAAFDASVPLEEIEDDVVFPPLASAGMASEEVLTLDFSSALADSSADDPVAEAVDALAEVRTAENGAVVSVDEDHSEVDNEIGNELVADSARSEAATALQIVNDVLPDPPEMDDDQVVALFSADAPDESATISSANVVAQVVDEFARTTECIASDDSVRDAGMPAGSLTATVEMDRVTAAARPNTAENSRDAAVPGGKASPGHRSYATLFTRLRRMKAAATESTTAGRNG